MPEEQPPLAAARQSHAKWARLGMVFYSPRSSPIGWRSSTWSQMDLATIMIGIPSNSPQIPQSQPQKITPTNTATGFMRLERLVR